MKKSVKKFVYQVVFWVCMILLGIFTAVVMEARSTEWHVSVSGFGAWDRGTWGSGGAVAPEGKQSQDIAFWMVAAQIRSDVIKLPWKLQPTVELSYQQRHYDFSTSYTIPGRKQPIQVDAIQKIDPEVYSGLGGVTKEWKYLNGYLLAGVSYAKTNLTMIDARGRHPKGHTGWFPVISLGIYKPFKIWKKLTVSPELKAYAYPYRPGMRRCRNALMGYVNPFLGIRLEW